MFIRVRKIERNTSELRAVEQKFCSFFILGGVTMLIQMIVASRSAKVFVGSMEICKAVRLCMLNEPFDSDCMHVWISVLMVDDRMKLCTPSRHINCYT